MTAQPSFPPPGPFDKDQVIQVVETETQSAIQDIQDLSTIRDSLAITSYTILELTEILQYLGRLNKVYSRKLDAVAEIRSLIIQELRIKTRRQIGE